MKFLSFALLLGLAASLIACASPTITDTTTAYSTMTSTITSTSVVTSTVTSSVTVTDTITLQTIGQLALKGEQTYISNCTHCQHSAFSGYKNAQNFLNAISTMSSGNQQEQWEILCYLMMQNKWVSGDTIFNPDTLSQLLLPG